MRTPTLTLAAACRRRRHGFTLVEIVVVVVIIAILAAIAIVGYTAIITRGKNASMTAAAEQIGKVLQAESANGQATISATAAGPGTASSIVSNIKVGANTLSAGAQTDLVAAAGANSTMQTASYWLLVSNPNWPNDGSCTVIFATKVGESPTTSCGTVVSAEGNLLTTDQATAQRAGYNATQTNLTVIQETATSLRATTAAASSVALNPTSYPTVQVGTTYHYEATISSPATNTKNASVLMQCYDAASAITGTYFGNNIAPGTTGISSKDFTPSGATTRCGAWPLYIAGPVAGEYFLISKVGMWAGTGGQWAPPGQPIYK